MSEYLISGNKKNVEKFSYYVIIQRALKENNSMKIREEHCDPVNPDGYFLILETDVATDKIEREFGITLHAFPLTSLY